MPRLTVQGTAGPPISYRFDCDRIRVGRASGCDLVLHDTSVSRVHLEIRRTDDSWFVTDLESSNGTRVDGRRIFEATRIQPGARILLGEGDTELLFEESVEGALPENRLSESMIETSSDRGGGGEGECRLVGDSAAMAEIRELARTVASAEAPVLITGENGTGKELVARRVHGLSPRRGEPFVVVNCPAIPRDLFESELFGVEKGVATGVEARRGVFECAEGGTVLLDEIGDLEPPAQAKLLRFLQDRRLQRVGSRESRVMDLRILAATNHDLERDIEEGRFRRDLYHRLNPLSIELPPLRERMEDLPALVEHFLEKPDGPRVPLHEDAWRALRAYHWPGNVRELDGVILRARLFARKEGIILREHLPDSVLSPGAAGEEEIYARLVSGEGSFWDLVHGPFNARELSRARVRAIVERGHREAGGSYKKMCALFGIEEETDYKKVLDWLRNNDLRVSD